MIDNSFDFLYSVLVKDFRFLDFNLLMDDPLNNLNNWLLNDFFLDSNDLMDERNLDDFLNDLFDCSVLNDRFLYNSFNFLNSVPINNFFYNYLHFNRFFNDIMHLDNFFNDLRNL